MADIQEWSKCKKNASCICVHLLVQYLVIWIFKISVLTVLDIDLGYAKTSETTQ